ncbi:helix-turn-helix domain-containing protein [Actinomadura nitritigenes]
MVPVSLCGPLLRVLMRALTREAREDGGTIPPGITGFLSDLAAATDRTPPGSAAGTDPGVPGTVEVSAAEMAEAMGASREYVRRLCRDGRLPARRIGRTWLIEIERNRVAEDRNGLAEDTPSRR